MLQFPTLFDRRSMAFMDAFEHEPERRRPTPRVEADIGPNTGFLRFGGASHTEKLESAPASEAVGTAGWCERPRLFRGSCR